MHTVTNAIEPIFFFLERVWSILGRNIPARYHEACKSGIGKAQRERERARERKKETRKRFRGVRRIMEVRRDSAFWMSPFESNFNSLISGNLYNLHSRSHPPCHFSKDFSISMYTTWRKLINKRQRFL